MDLVAVVPDRNNAYKQCRGGIRYNSEAVQ
jgi:hypothetical protein